MTKDNQVKKENGQEGKYGCAPTPTTLSCKPMLRIGNIAYFASVYPSHAIAAIPLIEALAERGHQVIYFAPSAFLDNKELKGLMSNTLNVKYVLYPSEALVTFGATLSAGGDVQSRVNSLLGKMADASDAIFPWATDLVAETKPNLIMYDHAAGLWGYRIAIHFRISSLCLLSMMQTSKAMLLSDQVVYGAVGGTPKEISLADSSALSTFYNIGVRSHFDVLTCSYDSPKIILSSSLSQLNADQFTVPEYVFFPTGCGQIKLGHTPDIKLACPRVYLSLGTVYNGDPSIFLGILSKIASQQEYDITVSTGNDPKILETLQEKYGDHPNVHLLLYTDQKQILTYISIFITHGGPNGFKEAVCSGTPTIILPLAGDQFYVCRQAESLDAGVCIQRGSGEFEAISIALLNITTNYDQFTQGILAIRASLVESPAVSLGLVEDMIKFS